MEKLFGIDISRYDDETIVTWWRYSKRKKSGCFACEISTRSMATYDRLYDIINKLPHLPSVHAKTNSLSVTYLF